MSTVINCNGTVTDLLDILPLLIMVFEAAHVGNKIGTSSLGIGDNPEVVMLRYSPSSSKTYSHIIYVLIDIFYTHVSREY